ncbi:hypothetical protein L596_029157 [Steinernema carpocapsae]|uniref:Uncharacterized protein n=1 Tax=Steinernema carpocapsae TaxID=34508 RepID=A0A4U5LTT5_STECR|nr:hypothetical protein L596_029157 [Steinernema carpocapsae]
MRDSGSDSDGDIEGDSDGVFKLTATSPRIECFSGRGFSVDFDGFSGYFAASVTTFHVFEVFGGVLHNFAH